MATLSVTTEFQYLAKVGADLISVTQNVNTPLENINCEFIQVVSTQLIVFRELKDKGRNRCAGKFDYGTAKTQTTRGRLGTYVIHYLFITSILTNV